jgi:hypothetical protein
MFSVASVVFLGLGCSSERDSISRRLDDLQSEITRLKAANIALQDRMEGVEAKPDEGASPAAGLVDDDRPELAVVTMSPEPSDAEPAMPPESDEDRPSIVGDRHRVEQLRGEPKSGHGLKP